MGGPDSLADVEPFLRRLFSDRKLIRLGPTFLQKPLATFIAKRRAPKSRDIYKLIGGGSPQKRLTLEQATCLEKQLAADGNFIVSIAMRYWSPSSEEAVSALIDGGIDGLIGLSLYPHYSRATGGSSLEDLESTLKRVAPSLPYSLISSWPEQPEYIEILSQNIINGLNSFPDDGKRAVVYSAHSLPVSFIEQGDPYVDHLHLTIQAVEKITGQKGFLCYQSRSGPVKWLAPSTEEMLKELRDRQYQNILMVPISFVSDHIETLYEIDMLYKDQAESLGMALKSSASLNSSPVFIEALRSLVLEQAERLTIPVSSK